MSEAELYDFAGRLMGETDAAYLVDDGEQKVWLPKSQTDHDGDGTFTVPQWLAEEKGLV